MKKAQGKTTYRKDYRAPDFLIDETHLEVQLFEGEAQVASRLRMRRNPQADSQDAPLILDGEDLELVSVALDGRELGAEEYQLDEESLTIPSPPRAFELACLVRCRPQDNTSLEGLYKSGNMFCTQCEAEGFRKITYYLDRPDVLSRFTTRVEADEKAYPVLLSNGNKAASGKLEQGRHWVVWEDPFRKPCYLFALVAGDLQSVDDAFTTCRGRTIALRIFVEAKDLDKCAFAMTSLKKAMRWDEEVYGREYDLDIFMIVAVDHFNMGAMENKGLNIFNSSCVLANPATVTDAAFQRIEGIVAHEYFHNWSGNRVTCRDWFQLSLKEGFTVFRDSEFSADMNSRTVKRIEDARLLRTVQFAEDAGPLAHPVRPESYQEISNFYTATVYEKGAEVVRMLAKLLGPKTFRAGTDRYFEKFDGMAVATDDFVAVMEEVSGLELSQFRRWYSQAGTPELAVAGRYDERRQTYTLSVAQHCPPTPSQPGKEPFHIPLAIGLLDTAGKELTLECDGSGAGSTSLVLHVTARKQDFVFKNIPQKPIPSLLRGFSAPVKLKAAYSPEDLAFLMSKDTDGFVRWEASQQLALGAINKLLADYRQGRKLKLDAKLTEAFAAALANSLSEPSLDKAMTAYLITLPSEAYIGELTAEIDVDGIHHARQFMRRELASALREQFEKIYEANAAERKYELSAEAMAQRQLKNTALHYLVLLEDEEWMERCCRQFRQADNMTDASAALQALIHADSELARSRREEALEEFYRTWQHEALVVEQWLAMQCAAPRPDNLGKVKVLLRHEAFDIRNPNRVRAVIGAFCSQNLVGFHAENGSGYEFLADQVIMLNALNPQIAARLLMPLTRWRKYNARRQSLMRKQLQRIRQLEGLSRDVFEVVSKSLA